VCIRATAAIGSVSIRAAKEVINRVITVARRNSLRFRFVLHVVELGIESLETRSLMSATLPLDASIGLLHPGGVNLEAPQSKAILIGLLLPAKAGPGQACLFRAILLGQAPVAGRTSMA